MRLESTRILYASTNQSWRSGWTFYQMLAERFARENDVVYVDPPVSVARGLPRVTVDEVGPRLRVLRVPAIPAQRTERMRRAAAVLTSRLVARWARRARFDPDLLWVYYPTEAHLADRFPRAKLVYWTGDDVVLPEDALLERADAVLCVSDPVYERHRARLGDKAHFVPVACDFERYNAALALEPPHELAHLPRPVVGYSGWVNARVDVDVVLRTAARLPDASLAIVGPVELAAKDVARLRAAPNVHLLGPQPADRVPPVIRGFDVALIPYRDTPFNHGSNPAKFYEYLAVGRPVVSTDVPTLHRFASVVSIGNGESFPERVAAALADPPGTVEERVAVARDHSFAALLERLRAVPL